MNLTRNGLIVLISIIFVAGAGTAYAGIVLPMITLAGNVQVDGTLNVDGPIIGPTIDNLQTQIDNIPEGPLSCENQQEINFGIPAFTMSPECIIQNLAVASRTSSDVSILLGTGTGSFGAATNFAVDTGPRSVAVGDFDGDTNLDLAVANDGSNNVSILLGTGTGSFGAATNFAVGSSPSSVAVFETR